MAKRGYEIIHTDPRTGEEDLIATGSQPQMELALAELIDDESFNDSARDYRVQKAQG